MKVRGLLSNCIVHVGAGCFFLLFIIVELEVDWGSTYLARPYRWAQERYSNIGSRCSKFSPEWSMALRKTRQDECGTLDFYPCWMSGLCTSMRMNQENWNANDCDSKWSRKNLAAIGMRVDVGPSTLTASSGTEENSQRYRSMSKTAKGLSRSVAKYESSLKCAPGKQRRGTAVLTFGNFRQKNVWHSMASMATIWHMTKIFQTKFDTVHDWQIGTGRFFTAKSNNFHWNYRSLFLNSMAESERPVSCFERVVFYEELQHRWQGLWWGFLYMKAGMCEAHSPAIASSVSSLRRSFLNLQADTLDILDLPPDQNKDGVRLCYMYRSPRFHRHLHMNAEAEMDAMLSRWSGRERGRAVFRANFSSSTPKLKQYQNMSQCDILFGLHGAGLCHMFWKKSFPLPASLKVLEVHHQPGKSCLPFYRKLSGALGHDYTCYNDLEGATIGVKQGTFVDLNITLIEATLESMSIKNLG